MYVCIVSSLHQYIIVLGKMLLVKQVICKAGDMC